MLPSIDNDAFFGGPSPMAPWPPRGVVASIPDRVFYGEARPPAEPALVVTGAATPLRFGALLFMLGWLGILIQRSPVRQIVVGAPVFEEFAKFGLALMVLAILGARSAVARLPYAWLSGLGFGVLEHALTYPDEPWGSLLLRAAFHASTCGLAMAVYSALEPHADVRIRWGSTLVSSLIHWANNFGAVALGVLATLAPIPDPVGLVWSLALAAGAVALTFAVIAAAPRFREAVARETARLLPALGVNADDQDPPSSAAPPAPPPELPPPGAP